MACVRSAASQSPRCADARDTVWVRQQKRNDRQYTEKTRTLALSISDEQVVDPVSHMSKVGFAAVRQLPVLCPGEMSVLALQRLDAALNDPNELGVAQKGVQVLRELLVKMLPVVLDEGVGVDKVDPGGPVDRCPGHNVPVVRVEQKGLRLVRDLVCLCCICGRLA